MAGKKVQIPTMGGLRKVIRTGDTTDVSATLAAVQSQLSALTTLVNSLASASSGSGGGGGISAALIPGPGLVGGGTLVGPVTLGLTGPLAIMLDSDSGGDSEPGPPGQRGIDGATGAGGPVGPAAFMAAADGEDGWHAVPGKNGTDGNTGAQGPVGPAVFMAAADGLDGDNGPPGPAGAAGVAGATGSAGPPGPAVFFLAEDGIDGDVGPPGAAGIAGSGTPIAYPGTLADLVHWWTADAYNVASGATLMAMTNLCPYYNWQSLKTGAGATRAASQLNSKNVFTFPGGANGRYNWQAGLTLKKLTVFAVIKPSSFASVSTFVCGGSNSFQFRIETSGKLGALKCNVANIGSATTAMSTGTWYQVNVTYDDSTGVLAFRQASATNGGATNAQTITADTSVTGYNGATGSEDLAGDLAELIVFNRVLSGTEISNVEAYLFAKWGV